MVKNMNEREEHFKKILIRAFPLLDSFDKGYMLGLLEGKVREAEKKEKKQKAVSKS